jgi:hypothetical protein
MESGGKGMQCDGFQSQRNEQLEGIFIDAVCMLRESRLRTLLFTTPLQLSGFRQVWQKQKCHMRRVALRTSFHDHSGFSVPSTAQARYGRSVFVG